MTQDDRANRVLVLGATSGIAEATARIYAAEGASLILAGRRADRLEQIADDLRLRGAKRVEVATLDLVDCQPNEVLSELANRLDGLDHIILAYGILGNQKDAEHDLQAAREILDVNFRSAAAWALSAADYLETQGSGALVVLGSVAGDRGRRANYIYGSAKAGLATLVQGLAHRLAGKGPRVVIVKPGPTDTAMTADMEKGGPLWAKPEQVARVVRRAADKGGPVVYAPMRWWWLMHIIRAIPTPIFNKLNI